MKAKGAGESEEGGGEHPGGRVVEGRRRVVVDEGKREREKSEGNSGVEGETRAFFVLRFEFFG